MPAHAGPVGSPFQMPTRLADGLGLESGRDDGSSSPFAPAPVSRGFGSPALTCRKASQLRLHTKQHSQNASAVSNRARVKPTDRGKFNSLLRQFHRELRTFANLAGDGDAALMRFDHGLYQA